MKHELIGNTGSLVDWDNFIANLNEADAKPTCMARSNDDFNLEVEFHRWLKAANINWSNVKWTDYNLEDTTTSIVEDFSKLVNSKMLRCFISKVDPGVCIPSHWDESDVKYYNIAKKENISRYVCFIQPPKAGHLLTVEDHCFYYVPQGSIYKWSNHFDFHSAANTGFESYYLFHFVGEDIKD